MACLLPTIKAQVQRRWLLTVFERCYSATELGRWQRRYDRLSQLQRRIRFAPLETITVGGETYQLPLPSIEPKKAPSQEELEYLVGFFDGDGCVTMQNSSGIVRLAMDQSADSAGILLHFRSLLGGGIYRSRAATGSAKAAVRWDVVGSKMTSAAAALGSVPSMKQAQLLIAAKGMWGKARDPECKVS